MKQPKQIVCGYSTVAVFGMRGFTSRSDGVLGRAFFTRHRDAVAWKRELYEHTRIRSKVVPVEVTMRVVRPKTRRKDH